MKKLCHSRTTKIIQVVTIKPNNYIVWQHQTKQFHCVTTCKNMILWQEDTAKNNVSSSPPPEGGPLWAGPFRAGEESCVGERVMKKLVGSRQMKKSCHSRTTKITQVVTIKPNKLHCTTTPNQTITLCDNTKPNNYIVWQHQTKQLHCTTTPNQTIPLSDNTKPNNSIVKLCWREGDEKVVAHKGAPSKGPRRGLWVTRGQQKLYKL